MKMNKHRCGLLAETCSGVSLVEMVLLGLNLVFSANARRRRPRHLALCSVERSQELTTYWCENKNVTHQDSKRSIEQQNVSIILNSRFFERERRGTAASST